MLQPLAQAHPQQPGAPHAPPAAQDPHDSGEGDQAAHDAHDTGYQVASGRRRGGEHSPNHRACGGRTIRVVASDRRRMADPRVREDREQEMEAATPPPAQPTIRVSPVEVGRAWATRPNLRALRS